MALLEEVDFSGGRRQRLRDWLHHQIFDARGARQELESKWKDELDRWRAQQPEGTKSAPYEGASNIKMPLVQQHIEPVYSDLMQTLHAGSSFWNTTARKSGAQDRAHAVQEGLDLLDHDFLNIREVNKKALLSATIHGTAVYKSDWLHESLPVRDYNPSGEIEKQVKTRSRPIIDHIPLQRFFFPPEAWSIQKDDQGGARWVAEQFLLRPEQLRAKAQSEGPFQPTYDPDATEFVLNQTRVDEEEVEEKLREQADYEPFRERHIEIFEVWASFDVDGDGLDEEIFVVWHQDTGTILRALHNPFLHGKRPYEIINYLPTQGIYGMGIAEKDEWAQSTMSRLVNAQVDNVLLANTRMFDAPLGSGIQPGEPIYPGKIWLREQGEQVRALQAGEVYPSLPQTISLFQEMSEQVTGVSEVRQGNVSELPSRTPASTTQALLSEGSKRFDFILNNMREPFGRLGMKTLQTLSQYYRQNPTKWDTYFSSALGEDADPFIDVLRSPIHNIESGFDIRLEATSSRANKEAEKQNFLSMLQITQQMYSGIIQTSQLAEQAPQGSSTQRTAAKAYEAGVELLNQLLKRFDLESADELTPRQVATQMGQMAEPQQEGPGAGGPPSPVPGQTFGGLQGSPREPSQAVRETLGLGE